MFQLNAHDRLGYEGQHRWRQHRRRRREYRDSYSRAWSRWNYGYSYQPLYDSDEGWIDYDNPDYYNDNTDYYNDNVDYSTDYDDWTSPAYDWTSPSYDWTSPAYFGATYIMFICMDLVVLC